MKISDIFLIFARNIDCGYMLEPPRRGGSNEYPAKTRKIGIPLHTPVSLYKSGVQGGGYSLHGDVLLMMYTCNSNLNVSYS